MRLFASLLFVACSTAQPPKPPHARVGRLELRDLRLEGHYLEGELANGGSESFDRVRLTVALADAARQTVRTRVLLIPDVDAPELTAGASRRFSRVVDAAAGLTLAGAFLEVVRVPPPDEPLAVVARAEWDPTPADLITSGACTPVPPEELRSIVVHHSDFAESPGPLVLEAYHREDRGWADIGYHFVVDERGRVYEARDIRCLGAHAGESLEANRGVRDARGDRAAVLAARKLDPDWGAIGIVVDGYFELGDSPTAAQLASLTSLVRSLQERYAIAATGVMGHLEVQPLIMAPQGTTAVKEPTTCPGPVLLQWAQRWRSAASSLRH